MERPLSAADAVDAHALRAGVLVRIRGGGAVYGDTSAADAREPAGGGARGRLLHSGALAWAERQPQRSHLRGERAFHHATEPAAGRVRSRRADAQGAERD